MSSLSLFGGEVTASSIRGRVRAKADLDAATGDFAGSGVATLTVAGAAVSTSPGQRVALGDWGYAIVLAQGSAPTTGSFRGNVTALEIGITVDHGGLPAGTQILVGYAEVAVTSPTPSPTTTASTQLPPKPLKGPKGKQAKPPEPGVLPSIVRQPPVGLRPKLTPSRYVFPVYGPSSFTNTFGAPRATTTWHHGEDIFAPLGAPLLAVTDGVVFSVGWNDVGGYRLWLRDQQRSSSTMRTCPRSRRSRRTARTCKPATCSGSWATRRRAGTPYHRTSRSIPSACSRTATTASSRRIHICSRGAASPTSSCPDGSGWAPLPTAEATAPKAGAIVLQVSDISTASGLRPARSRARSSRPSRPRATGLHAPSAAAARGRRARRARSGRGD